MAVKQHIASFLDEHHVPYTTQQHPQAFTAQRVAAAEHVSGNVVAKAVILVANDQPVMFVLPASHRVDLQKAAALLGVDSVRFATEREFAGRFADCELGALPPLGNLYGLPVYVDESLASREQIVFRAGTHTDTVAVAYTDFAKMVPATVADISR